MIRNSVTKVKNLLPADEQLFLKSKQESHSIGHDHELFDVSNRVKHSINMQISWNILNATAMNLMRKNLSNNSSMELL